MSGTPPWRSGRAGVRAAAACVRVARPALAEMVEHARTEAPRECCGLLIGDARMIARIAPARNLADQPSRYLIDPADHFRAIRTARVEGLTVMGAYHSHPAGPAAPSATDLAEASDPEFVYVIVSLTSRTRPRIRAYRLAGGTSQQVRLVPAPARRAGKDAVDRGGRPA